MNILINDGAHKDTITTLKEKGFNVIDKHFNKEELKEKIKEVDVLIVRSKTKVTKNLIDEALKTRNLKLILRAGVGLDNIDLNYAKENGIEVHNTPLASSRSVAELTIGHIMSLARHVHISNVTMREGKWNKKDYKGFEVFGKTLGIIGFGNIGRQTATIAQALGMNVIYTDKLGKRDDCPDFKFVQFNELLRQSDFITLHVPFIKDEGYVISHNEFKQMKDGVFIINVARGGVVSEEALLRALNEGKVAGAGIDVFEEEPTRNEDLINHNKVCITPHIGASTAEAQERIGMELVDKIVNFKM
ncbi:D-2-hydroxyacid dehydrogenase [Anaeromicrobium sediminis]|uniref:2-oxoglutarate reductase n=1 Tax=Anaeromicrobium sediminis TaxID=1478221 RepID=A0A267MHK5_9FIRM|nr:D-2-hydroxyacid dehydrogenase [Anaeromicrobium sediminis]PAB58408.1 3-phosphoglycerate dehydrogenase [Anaeromicrobium sediminis]